jgi:drug/metabolite transporter (DMT)-like permease
MNSIQNEPTAMSWRSWMAFAALGVIWGVPYFFIKLALQGLSPAALACGRLLVATLILLPIAWRRGALRAVMDHKPAVLAFAIAEFAIPFSAICIGERWISSALTGILIATVPLTIALLSRSFGVHERLGVWRLAGLLLGLVGVATLLGFGTISWPLGWAGVGCMLLAVVGYAIGPLIIQRYLRTLIRSARWPQASRWRAWCCCRRHWPRFRPSCPRPWCCGRSGFWVRYARRWRCC